MARINPHPWAQIVPSPQKGTGGPLVTNLKRAVNKQKLIDPKKLTSNSLNAGHR